MPKQHTYTSYSFEELTPEAQKAAIENTRKVRYDVPAELESWLDSARTDLESMGFVDAQERKDTEKFHIHYSLGYSQGDGVAFTGTIDVMKLLRYFADTQDKDDYITDERREEAKKLLERIKSLDIDVNSKDIELRVEQAETYAHSNPMGYEWVTPFSELESDLQHELPLDEVELLGGPRAKEADALDSDVMEFVKEAIRAVSKKKEKDGYAEIEYQQSDEYLRELITAADFQFHQDGRIFREP